MKRNLLLLHGAMGSIEQFQELNDLLLPYYDVHAFNFSGHGGQVFEEDFSIERFVEDTTSFMNDHGIADAHLFGYSMGGYVALKLAGMHPERVDRVITLGTKFKWDPEAAAKEVRMMNPDIIEQKIPAFAASLAARHQPADWKSIMTRTADMMTELGAGQAMTSAEFGAIENEVLVCIGTEDHMVTIEESEKTAKQLKNGQLKIIDGFKHPLEAVDKNTLALICIEYFA